MIRLDLKYIAGTRPWERLEFDTTRAARSYLLHAEKQAGARREGNGTEGKLVCGKGSAKRIFALYEISEV